MNMIGNEKLMFDEKGMPFYRRTISKDGEFEDIQPEQCTLPLVKTLALKIILKREGYTPDMRVKIWYGIQEIRISVPNENQFKYHFLVFDPKAMSNVCVKLISPAMYDSFGNFNSFTNDFCLQPSKESIEFSWVKRIGKPKTITAQKVAYLIAQKEVLGVVTDNGQEVN